MGARKKRQIEEKQRKLKQNRQSTEEDIGKIGKGAVPKWKSQSAALRKAMLEARGKGTKDMFDVLEVGAETSSLIPCPHCGRKFNQTAADRHIPQCQNIKAKPKTLKKNTGMSAVAKALSGKSKSKSTITTRIL